MSLRRKALGVHRESWRKSSYVVVVFVDTIYTAVAVLVTTGAVVAWVTWRVEVVLTAVQDGVETRLQSRRPELELLDELVTTGLICCCNDAV